MKKIGQTNTIWMAMFYSVAMISTIESKVLVKVKQSYEEALFQGK